MSAFVQLMTATKPGAKLVSQSALTKISDVILLMIVFASKLWFFDYWRNGLFYDIIIIYFIQCKQLIFHHKQTNRCWVCSILCHEHFCGFIVSFHVFNSDTARLFQVQCILEYTYDFVVKSLIVFYLGITFCLHLCNLSSGTPILHHFLASAILLEVWNTKVALITFFMA